MQLGFFGLAAVYAATLQTQTEMQENPVRRIITLLGKMKDEIAQEGAKDDEMNARFECYCQKSDGELGASIESLNTQIPQIEADIKETGAEKAQLAADLEAAKQTREDAKASIASATAQREKEAAAFAHESGELNANIGACGKAIDAIEKGMAGSFLQSAAAAPLRNLAMTSDKLDIYSRGVLTDFLSTSQGYGPKSGEITGILKQLLENMETELAEATAAEKEAIAEFDGLVAAKKKTIAAATESIETKTAQAGETAVKFVSLKNDLETATAQLADDSKMLGSLKSSCAQKAKEYAERKALRAEETVAIAETVKILSDDESLSLFKKTLPSPSLLQVTASDRQIRDQALAALDGVPAGPHSAQVAMIQSALNSKKAVFAKIVKKIDDLLALLSDEQKDDDEKKAYCEREFDTSEDNEKDLKRKISGLNTKIDETKDAIATLASDIAALTQGINDLDAAVSEATADRKAENALFVQTKAENTAALQLLGLAVNRLNKLYNPKLYKAPPKRELTEEERIYVASGGVLTTPAPGGIAGTGVTVFEQVGSTIPPPPATADAYKKRDSSGPIALINGLIGDLEKDIQANAMNEKEAQKDYEELMSESAAKRAADSKSISEKESQKAGLEADLGDAKADNKNAKKELLALTEYIAELHGSCDFLVQNFDLRKEARAGEVSSLQRAKAVLSGADYSFVQTKQFLARA